MRQKIILMLLYIVTINITIYCQNNIFSHGATRFTSQDNWDVYKIDRKTKILTNHGVSLDAILIRNRPLKSNLPYTKRKITKNMLQLEIAESVIHSVRSSPNIHQVVILDISPKNIQHRKGVIFKLKFTNNNGIKKIMEVFCFTHKKQYYEFRFVALARFYFQNGHKDFLSLLESIEL